MGRHITGAPAADQRPAARTPPAALAPVTDPLLLDAVEEAWRRPVPRAGTAAVNRAPAPPVAGPRPGMRRIETPFSGFIDVPDGPASALDRPAERSRRAAAPPDGRGAREAPAALPRSAPPPPVPAAAVAPAAAPPQQPVPARTGLPQDPVPQRSLSGLLAEDPDRPLTVDDRLDLLAARRSPARPPVRHDDAPRTGSRTDSAPVVEDADRAPVHVGFSAGSLLLTLGLGLGAAVALSVVAVLPL